MINDSSNTLSNTWNLNELDMFPLSDQPAFRPGSVLVTGALVPLVPLGPLGPLDPGQRSWGCSPRFPRLVDPERPERPERPATAAVAAGEDAETEDASVEVWDFCSIDANKLGC